MAFDRSNPADLLILKTEVNTDPLGIGYPLNNPTQIIKLINNPASNLGGETTNRAFDAAALLDALDPQDFSANQTSAEAAAYTQTLVSASRFGGVDIEILKPKWRGMFAGNSSTVAALDAQTMALSRAEVLFGQGTTLVRDDWFAARDS